MAMEQSSEEKILAEVKQIKRVLSDLVGTSDKPAKEKFSKEALDKAAKEYRKLSIERGNWIPGDEISKVIRHAPWHIGKFIIEQFEFTNYFKRGSTYYFNRKDLLELKTELQKRNIDLKKYCELYEDQVKFRKYIASIQLPKGKKTRQHFRIPENLRDIFSKPYSAATEELVRNEINGLFEEYNKFDLSEYVDLYHGKTYALFKYDYHFDRYLKPEPKKFCRDWCFKFNYANEALKRIVELKSSQELLSNQQDE